MTAGSGYFSLRNSISSANSSGLCFSSKAQQRQLNPCFPLGSVCGSRRANSDACRHRTVSNRISILAIIRVEVLNAGKRRLRDVGVISEGQISIVVNDVNAVIELAHFHLFFAVCRSRIAKQSFLYFLSGARCNWNFVFARTESQNAQANRNAEAKPAMNQIR